MIVDSRHHFWHISKMNYFSMPTGESIVRRNYLPSDLASNLEAAGVTRTVIVQETNHKKRQNSFSIWQMLSNLWLALLFGRTTKPPISVMCWMNY